MCVYWHLEIGSVGYENVPCLMGGGGVSELEENGDLTEPQGDRSSLVGKLV